MWCWWGETDPRLLLLTRNLTLKTQKCFRMTRYSPLSGASGCWSKTSSISFDSSLNKKAIGLWTSSIWLQWKNWIIKKTIIVPKTTGPLYVKLVWIFYHSLPWCHISASSQISVHFQQLVQLLPLDAAEGQILGWTRKQAHQHQTPCAAGSVMDLFHLGPSFPGQL